MQLKIMPMLLLHVAIWSLPKFLSCKRPLAVGEDIMRERATLAGDKVGFNGRACGSTFEAGERLQVTVGTGSSSRRCLVLLDVGGGAVIEGGRCDGARKDLGQERTATLVAPATPSGPISVWFGIGCDPNDGIEVSNRCELFPQGVRPDSGAVPPSSAAPHISPTTTHEQAHNAAATSTAAASVEQPLRHLHELHSKNGALEVSLVLGRTQMDFHDGLVKDMVSFNSSIPGPTLRLRAGEVLRLSLSNALASPPTNMHMHGLHVSPAEDDTFAQVPAGGRRSYSYTLPDDHHAGTFWYHPHAHPEQAEQAGAGAFGLVIVEDAPRALPAALGGLEELALVMHHITLGDGATRSPAIAGGASLTPRRGVVLLNGQERPLVAAMVAGRWYRWRLLFVAVNAILEPRLPSECETLLLAKDGIYLSDGPRRVSAAFLAPGSRADWLISCAAGHHPLSATLTGADGTSEEVTLGTVQVAADQLAASPRVKLPAFRPLLPCHLADLRSTAAGVQLRMDLRGIAINGRSYAGPGTLEASLPVGGIAQFNVSGAHADGTTTGMHPFHVHTHAFQLVAMPKELAAHRSGHFAVGDWHDTWVQPAPPAGAPAAEVAVRLAADRYTGLVPLHCHAFDHSDMGMMLVIAVRGSEGTRPRACRPSSTAAAALPRHAVATPTAAPSETAPPSGDATDAIVDSARIALLASPTEGAAVALALALGVMLGAAAALGCRRTPSPAAQLAYPGSGDSASDYRSKIRLLARAHASPPCSSDEELDRPNAARVAWWHSPRRTPVYRR